MYIQIFAIALAGFSGTYYLYHLAVIEEISHGKVNFYQETQNFAFSIKERAAKYQLLMRGIQSFFIASEKVTLQEWKDYCKSLNIATRFPSIRLLGVVRGIPKSEREAAIRELQSLGISDFKIWPLSESDSLHPIVYVEPEAYSQWVGFDVCQNEEICAAVRRATEGTETVVAPSFSLNRIQTQKSLQTFWLAIAKGKEVGKEGKGLPFGWVMIFIDFASVIDLVASEMQLKQINVQVFEGKEQTADQLVLARVSNPDPSPLFTATQVFTFGGKEWTFLFSTGPGYKVTISYFHPLVLLTLSSAVVLFLMALTYCTSRKKGDVEKKVSQAEEDLAAAVAMRQAVLDSANYSIICTDKKGMILVFNKAAEKMLGYRAEEMVGKQTPMILHDTDEISVRAKELSDLFGRTVPPGPDAFIALAEKGIPDERNWTYIRKDKTRIPIVLSMTAVREPNGNVIGFLGIAREKK